MSEQTFERSTDVRRFPFATAKRFLQLISKFFFHAVLSNTGHVAHRDSAEILRNFRIRIAWLFEGTSDVDRETDRLISFRENMRNVAPRDIGADVFRASQIVS